MIRCFNRFFFSIAVVLGAITHLRAESTWLGNTNDVLTATNWSPTGVPTPASTGTGGPGTDGTATVGQADFVNGTAPVMNGAWNPKYIAFFGNINSLSGSGTLTIGTSNSVAGNIDSWKATSPVTISVADIILLRNSNIYAASAGG